MHSFHKGRRFFVMKYLPQSLEELINSAGEDKDKRDKMLASTAVQMLEVVKKFHELGFLHRDIKPSNFRVLDGQVYLTDFGTVNSYKDDKGNHI